MTHDPDSAVDRKGIESPYLQLAGILAARIKRGDWQPGRRMASEVALQQEYGLARKTVRRAIGVLVDEGLAVVVPQRGTFVKPAKKTPRNDVTVAEPQ